MAKNLKELRKQAAAVPGQYAPQSRTVISEKLDEAIDGFQKSAQDSQLRREHALVVRTLAWVLGETDTDPLDRLGLPDLNA